MKGNILKSLSTNTFMSEGKKVVIFLLVIMEEKCVKIQNHEYHTKKVSLICLNLVSVL